MRFEVLTATVNMSMLVFWIVTQCGLVGGVDTNILEEHTASIFSAEGPGFIPRPGDELS
jgi:hypothetical protein